MSSPQISAYSQKIYGTAYASSDSSFSFSGWLFLLSPFDLFVCLNINDAFSSPASLISEGCRRRRSARALHAPRARVSMDDARTAKKGQRRM
jgi:hypothetical protein